ncbi:4'-phosphopantetheinyl transferase family protein [Nocardioides acrostichi]|uniref:4'-phosphopantetheinyl transferase n=1 Tax=Nocardioides acrostichi TaxID=2784339 RepID=A0A930V2Z3_9ACTN|nr:hypothetical protein [Nocardioides acrostichi]MBF4162931.1 hypothetical protein [Nocardioides acrostichi]
MLVEVTALFADDDHDDHHALRALAQAHLGHPTRLCPHCASTAHGRPRSRTRGERLSISYARGLVVTARATARVGVDVEHTGQAVPDGLADLTHWTRSEAVLKATGTGLRRDPAGVRADEAHTLPLPLPDGWVGSVAVLDATEIDLAWLVR